MKVVRKVITPVLCFIAGCAGGIFGRDPAIRFIANSLHRNNGIERSQEVKNFNGVSLDPAPKPMSAPAPKPLEEGSEVTIRTAPEPAY